MVIIRWYLETWSIHTLLAVVLLSGLMVSCTKEEQEKVADCCVTAPLSEERGEGYVDNYLGVFLGRQGTAGKRLVPDQVTGRRCVGALRHRTSNHAFLDGTAAYLGFPAGGVRVGQTSTSLS